MQEVDYDPRTEEGNDLSLGEALHFIEAKEPEALQVFDDGLSAVAEPTPEDLAAEEAKEEPEEPVNAAQLVRAVRKTDPDDAAFDGDTVSMYFREVTESPLLTYEEEQDLFRRIERGHKARNERLNTPLSRLSNKRRADLHAAIDDGLAARDTIITSNLRLVISVAKKYMGRGVPFLDLIQEGNVGLIRASKKFEYARGNKFSTYATWWIRQAITRGIVEQSRGVRLPVHMTDQVNAMMRITHELTQKLGREPTPEDLAVAMDQPVKKIIFWQEKSRFTVSLDAPTDDEENSTLGDFIEDERQAPIDEATQQILRTQLDKILGGIPPRERRVLELRYGLRDGQAFTLEEVGRMMGVTRERIRQIENQALGRLRHPGIRRVLRDYLSDV